MKPSSWKQLLKMEREQKDTFFSTYPTSPLPVEDREGFEGLDYYPPNPEYRLKLKLYKHDEKKSVEMAYTGGGEKEFL